MVYAAIGGMQLKRWTGYFKIIGPTLRVLKSAKHADGCVRSDTFKAGRVYFAISVWDSKDQMRAFAKSGLHSTLAQVAMGQMLMFHNHTAEFETVPNRQDCVTAWQAAITARDGKGTVGIYTA